MNHKRTPQLILTLVLMLGLCSGVSLISTVGAQVLGPGAQVDFRELGINTWRKGGTIKECS